MHNFIAIAPDELLSQQVLHHRDYNPFNFHTLDLLPNRPAIYAVFGRVHGQLANCRLIDISENLQQSILDHYSNPAHQELGEYMRSIKIKCIVYKCIDPMLFEDHLSEWRKRFFLVKDEVLKDVY
jgi:hypothetical protein